MLVLAAAGCASAVGRGQTALRQGRWADAARHFEEALTAGADDAAALLGLGIARYKVGALDLAGAALERAVGLQPDSREARLYLALVRLRTHDDDRARASLQSLRELGPSPRLAAQIERALPLIGPDLGDRFREFMAAGLEDELEWEREVQRARRASAYTQPSWIIYRDSWPWYPFRRAIRRR